MRTHNQRDPSLYNLSTNEKVYCKVYELRPLINGLEQRSCRWLVFLKHGLDNPLKTHFPSTIGDDKTDKDAFQVIDFIMKNACN